MGFKDIPLEISYDSDETDIAAEFYRPLLKEAKTYRRLAGYFSSTTFAIAIGEILEFIENGGTMKLVTSTEISKQDKKTFEEYVHGDSFGDMLIEKLKLNQDQIFKDCAALMGWMLSNKVDGQPQLEIKIAITTSIYHQKVGIFSDAEDNLVSFEGSVNETGKAWNDNVEKFKVSTSWGDESDSKRISIDIKTFNKFWENRAQRTTVIDLPTAVKEELLKVRPSSTAEYNEVLIRLKKSLRRKKLFKLRDYQTDAINEWEKNNCQGIFSMATGSGKTFAAFGCVNRLQINQERIAVIIACPYTHLVTQWKNELKSWNKNFDPTLRLENFSIETCFSDIPNWEQQLKRKIRDFNEMGVDGKYFLNKLLIFTTHSTMASEKFVKLTESIDGPICIIADEVHAVGSELRLECLLQKYQYRLGLSATPTRYFDDEGTKKLQDYFNKTVYEFSIHEAIKRGFLVPYRYIPTVIELTEEEFELYRELTRKIARKLAAQGINDIGDDEISNFIEGARANIVSAAINKYDAFKKILDSIPKLQYALIYSHENQLERVKEILYDKGIVYHQITYRETTKEREKILKLLAEGSYDATIAIRCLDEGVNIPSAKIGIILASTGNPRQYIQRRGRLLRIQEGKKEAVIYDILVVPYLNRPLDEETSELERKMVTKELTRYEDFLISATNKMEARKEIEKIRRAYGLDLKIDELTTNDLLGPILEILRDGTLHTKEEVESIIAKDFGFSYEDVNKEYPVGRKKIQIRVGDALHLLRTYNCLEDKDNKAGKGIFMISDKGLKVLEKNREKITESTLKNFSE